MDAELQEVKPLRRGLGLTQKQLAQAAGVSQSLIAKVEAGLLDPSYSAGRRILSALRSMKQQREPCAREVMQRRVIACRSDEKLAAAIAKMERHAISQLPVLDGDNVVGLLTESGIVQNMQRIRHDETLVGDVMGEAPPIVPLETPRRAIAELLGIYSLLLVKERGKLRGIISKADLLRTV
jgi:predicted transcriptional regulator